MPRIQSDPKAELNTRLDRQAKGLRYLIPQMEPDCTRGLIHRVRVLTRRLRAASAALETAYTAPRLVPTAEQTSPSKLPSRDDLKRLQKLKRRLKKLGRNLSPVRSLDVLNVQVKNHLSSVPRKRSKALRFVRKALKKKQQRARQTLKESRQKLIQQLKPPPFSRILRKLDSGIILGSLEHTVAEETRDLLLCWQAFEKSGKLPELHQVRIHLKKWKYLMEIQNLLLPADQQKPVEDLKNFQDKLGEIRDQQVLLEELESEELQNSASHKELSELQDWIQNLQTNMKQRIHDLQKAGQPSFMTQLIARSA